MSKTQKYSLDNGVTWNTYSEPIFFNKDGKYSILYYSTDVTGEREAPKIIKFNLDQTAPSITFSGNQKTYSVDQNISISSKSDDQLSGIVLRLQFAQLLTALLTNLM